MQSKPAVCFVCTGPAMPGFFADEAPTEVGGIELQLWHISAELAQRGWPVSFVLGDYGQQMPPCGPHDIRLVVGHAPHRHSGALGFVLRGLRPLLRALDQADAAIYFQHGLGPLTGPVVHHVRRRGRKSAYAVACTAELMVDGPDAPRYGRLQRWSGAWGIRHTDLLLAQSEEQQRLATERWGREAPLMRNVWPGPFGPTDGERDDTVVWVGTMRPVKRPELVLELARRLPEIRFVVVGGPTGKTPELFRHVCAEAEKLPNVEIVGFVPPNEVDRHFLEAALLLNTSTVEGFPNAFLHAWGRHKPVVSTNDPNEMLTRRGFGRHATTVDELASAITELCADRALRRQIGAAACAYVVEHHAHEQVITQLESDLLALLAPGPPQGGGRPGHGLGAS